MPPVGCDRKSCGVSPPCGLRPRSCGPFRAPEPEQSVRIRSGFHCLDTTSRRRLRLLRSAALVSTTIPASSSRTDVLWAAGLRGFLARNRRLVGRGVFAMRAWRAGPNRSTRASGGPEAWILKKLRNSPGIVQIMSASGSRSKRTAMMRNRGSSTKDCLECYSPCQSLSACSNSRFEGSRKAAVRGQGLDLGAAAGRCSPA